MKEKSNRLLLNIPIVEIISRSFMMMVPIFLLQAVFLCVESFPIGVYQKWLSNQGYFFGRFLSVFNNSISFLFSPMVACLIGYNFGMMKNNPRNRKIFVSLTTVCSYIVMLDIDSKKFDIELLSSAGMFTAVIVAILSSIFFDFCGEHIRIRKHNFTHLNNILSEMLSCIFPMSITIAVFAAINEFIDFLSDGLSFQSVISNLISSLLLFLGQGNSILLGFFFLLFVMILWCFGVNGFNFLYSTNMEAILDNMSTASSNAGTGFISRSFISTFTLLGGSGCLLALAVAILIKSKDKTTRDVARLGIFPSIFNMGGCPGIWRSSCIKSITPHSICFMPDNQLFSCMYCYNYWNHPSYYY